MFNIFKSICKTKLLQGKIEHLHDELDILADTYNTMEAQYRKEISMLRRKIQILEAAPTKTIIKYKGK